MSVSRFSETLLIYTRNFASIVGVYIRGGTDPLGGTNSQVISLKSDKNTPKIHVYIRGGTDPPGGTSSQVISLKIVQKHLILGGVSKTDIFEVILLIRGGTDPPVPLFTAYFVYMRGGTDPWGSRRGVAIRFMVSNL